MINEAKERALISANEIANKLFPIPEQFLERKNFREGFAKGWLARTRQAAEDAERWLAIEAWGGRYEVSSLGYVRRTNDRALLGQSRNSDGYMIVRLSQPRSLERVHRLVAKAFIPNPENLPCINHIDSDPSNNNMNNLEWCTQKQNLAHARSKGRMPNNYWSGERTPIACLDEADLAEIKRLRSEGLSLSGIAERVGCSKRTVHRYLKGETYKSDPLPPPPAEREKRARERASIHARHGSRRRSVGATEAAFKGSNQARACLDKQRAQ